MADENETDADSRSPINIVVYLHDETGIMFKVQDGQNAEAKFLFDLVIKELKVDNRNVRDVFSLWLVSDLLELQLKPNHIPFKLVCYWEELLDKYVHCNEETKQRDEAVIMLQRNVYVHPKVEEEISDPYLLKLLYCEARKNVINGKYPLKVEDADMLAVLQAHIMSVDGEKSRAPNYDFFLNHAKDILPGMYTSRNLLINRKQNPEHRLSNLYEQEVVNFKEQDLEDLHMSYLQICRNSITYGAAFFRGQAEHRGKRLDDPVWIGINLHGVTIICITDQTTLLMIPYENLSWQFAESTCTDSNFLPCLFLHFPHSETNQKTTKLVQIFSKSAYLADNLIETLVNLRKKDTETTYADTVICDAKRMALMTFDPEGKPLGSTIRKPKHKMGGNSHPV